MNRKQQRETLLTMLDEEMLTDVIKSNFPAAMSEEKKYSTLADKIEFVIDKFDNEKKYAELLSQVVQMHEKRGEKK